MPADDDTLRALLDQVLALRTKRSVHKLSYARGALPLKSPRERDGGISFVQHQPAQRSVVAQAVPVSRVHSRQLAAVTTTPALQRCYEEGQMCAVLVVALAGYGGGGLVRHEFVAACAKAGVSHALFVKDALQAWYLLGLGEGGGEEHEASTFDSVVRAILNEVTQLRPQRLVLLGASMGGYAAIRAGIALARSHVEHAPTITVLAFGPQVFIDPEERGVLRLPPTHWETELRRLKGICANRGLRMASAADVLLDGHGGQAVPAEPLAESSGAMLSRPVVDIVVHVGALAAGDVREARLLEEAAQGAAIGAAVCVTIHETVGHSVVRKLRENGVLDKLLRTYVSA